MPGTRVPAPDIAVVVATRNRSHLLPRLIAALEEQADAPPFEVVVVDDGSTDDTSAVLARLAQSAALDLRVLRLEHNQGPASARNAGWLAAGAPLIAFTDDDCVPQLGWLRALADGLSSSDIAQGRTAPHPEQPLVGPFAWAPQMSEMDGFYETCNIGYRRSALTSVDGFDERFRRPWGEDTDLALRAIAAGAVTASAPDAVVWHDIRPGRLRDRLVDLPRRGDFVLLVKRHPEMRSRLETRWFARRVHRDALAMAVATLWALRRPRHAVRLIVPLAFLTVWARRRGASYPKGRWPRVLPQWLVVDLVEMAVLARASLKYRTVVL